MKSAYPLIKSMLLAILVVLGGCASNAVHPVVSQDSVVSRDKALIVMGVSFIEKYNDTEDKKIKKLISADLLKDEKKLKEILDEEDGTALDQPLHYLSRFRFQFMAENDTIHEFIRFNLDTREYEAIAIHEFVPGSIRLINIVTEQHWYREKLHARGSESFWEKHWVNYEKPFGSWDIQAGKVTYLGHLTMYFTTKRFIHGILTPSELVESTTLVAIVIEDRFEEVKTQLENEKPWFPATEMENQSRPGKWIYQQKAFDEFNEDDSRKAEEAERKSKAGKRDKKKFFF